MASQVNSVWKENFCSVSHNHFRERIFKYHIGMFLNTPGVCSADIYFLWAADVQNKKKNRKKMI